MQFTSYLLGIAALAAISSAQSTTVVNVFDAGTSTIAITMMEASIINVDATATTYAITCKPGATDCSLPSAATITNGPSTFEASIAYSSMTDGVQVALTVYETCVITASTQGASCSESVAGFVSYLGETTSTSATAVSSFPASQIYYNGLTVTAGIEKLNQATTSATSTGAAPTQKVLGGAVAAAGIAAWALV